MSLEEEEGEVFYVCGRECPVYDAQFDPVTVGDIPAPMAVLPAGAEFRVRYTPAYDDTVRDRSAEEQASGWEPPLSTVRGRVGGWDDVDDATASSRLMDLAWRVSSASHAAAAENIASSAGSALGLISDGSSQDNDLTGSQDHNRVARTSARTDSNAVSSNDSTTDVASPSSRSERNSGNGSGNGRRSSTGPTAAAAAVPHSLNPPRFFWLEVLSPHKGWALDTSISDSNGQNGAQEDITRTTTSVPLPQGRVAGSVLARRGSVKESSRWVYRVVCADGALVRTGLELSSPLRYTLALHALVEISERRLNDQGLARLRTADGRGWLSEQLNPLSGHRGPIATLLPMPTVLKVKVAIQEGALVRQTCELSSPSIRLVPRGEELLVVSKLFSDHPANRCIPRLQLADGTGWISQKLNREPPLDTLVCTLEGATDISAMTRLEEMRVERQAREVAMREARMVERRAHLAAVHGQDQQAALSSNTGERVEGLVGAMHQLNVGNSSSSAATGSSPPHGLPSPPLQRSYSSQSNFPSFADGDNRLFGDQGGDRDCVVCLAAERTATIVHGETGHIACCMECARVLKARGDPCPVCRMPIDLVVQHFWA